MAAVCALLASAAHAQKPQAPPPNAVGAAPAAAPADPDLAERASREDGGEVTLIVTNGTRAPIRVNWVDHDGQEGTSEDTVGPGESAELGTTFAGHFFRVRSTEGNAVLSEFRVKDNGGRFEIAIAGSGAAAAPAAPAGGEGPDGKKAAPVAAAKGGHGGVAVPAKGPHVELEVARRNLKSDLQQQIDEFLKLHNDARAEVGLPALTWDPKLAAVAQQWAETLAARGDELEHNTAIEYGENLAGYLPQYGERPVHGAKMWYDEIEGYTGQEIGAPEPPVVGHYTQMVWRSTARVGFGMAMTPSGMAILCANYSPGGNTIGERPY
jgi:hypothetical protein